MRIILLERVAHLGQMGDEVTVKPGYARNFLLPMKKALRANKGNREHFESQRVQLEARNLELKKEAEAIASKLDAKSFMAIRQAGDSGQLYGSVSTRDITDIIVAAGFTIARNQVALDRPIKTLGMHPIRVSLHPEVEVNVVLNVARSEEEAQRQARGEDVTRILDEVEEEMTVHAEDFFESEAVLEQVEADIETPADKGDQ